MVAQEESTRNLLLQFEENLDHTTRVGTAVNVVAEKDEFVVGSKRQRLQEFPQSFGLSVNVPDGVEHRRVPPPGLLLRPKGAPS